MKKVRLSDDALLLREDIRALVDKGYFSDEDYAVAYMINVVRHFQLNAENLVHYKAPAFFNRFGVTSVPLQYMKYIKNHKTTWYAFFEENDEYISIVYLNTNHAIGHLFAE